MQPRTGAPGVVFGGWIYIIGGVGEVDGAALLSVERLNLTTGQWEEVGLWIMGRMIVIKFLSSCRWRGWLREGCSLPRLSGRGRSSSWAASLIWILIGISPLARFAASDLEDQSIFNLRCTTPRPTCGLPSPVSPDPGCLGEMFTGYTALLEICNYC